MIASFINILETASGVSISELACFFVLIYLFSIPLRILIKKFFGGVNYD